MALYLAQRVNATRQPSTFTDTVEGALITHALFRVRHLAVPAQQTQADYDLAARILADPSLFIQPTIRLILHSAEQAALSDVTSLTDEQVTTMVETMWGALVQVVEG